MAHRRSWHPVAAVLLAVLLTGGLVQSSFAQCDPTKLFDQGYLLGLSGSAIATADVNADGVPDLLYGYPDIVLDDFNGDGILDIATQQVSVALGLPDLDGNGTGSFDLPTTYGVAKQDTLTVLLGNGANGSGDGTFSAPSYFDAGLPPGDMASGDFNGDSIVDLVVTARGSADSLSFVVLLGGGANGMGDGTFSLVSETSQKTLSSSNRWDVAVADFNQDSRLDLAVGSYDKVFVFLGNGDTTFATGVGYSQGGPYGGSVKVHDLDRDGILDLVVALGEFTGAEVAILRGQVTNGLPDGSFRAAEVWRAAPVEFGGAETSNRDVVIADFDHDGLDDLLTTSRDKFSGDNLVSLLTATGPRTYASFIEYQVPANAGRIVVADWNSDGALDLAIGSPSLAVVPGRCPAPQAGAPVLLGVRDVPNDQGGHVAVRWSRSPLDRATRRLITGYIVWRRIPEFLAMGRPPALQADIRVRRDAATGTETFWEPLETLPAHFLEGYGYVAPTTQDSIPGKNPYTAFFVSAITEDPFLFFESNVDSGYSIDNLAPMKPTGLAGDLQGGGFRLHWNANREEDLAHYALYRGQDPSFDPGANSFIAAVADTVFVDPGFKNHDVYKLAALDIHGNASPFAVLEPGGPIAVEIQNLSATSADDGVRIAWQIPSGALPELRRVRILRARDPAGPYEERVALTPSSRMTFLDEDVEAQVTYWYQVAMQDHAGNTVNSQAIGVLFTGFHWTTKLEVPRIAPASGPTSLKYTIARSNDVRIGIYDVAGRRVRLLAQGTRQPGRHETAWDGRDSRGRPVARGVYVVQLVSGAERISKKLIRVR